MKKILFVTIATFCTLVCAAQNGKNAKNGELPGAFSVSSNAQVKFSQGNLQYQASKDIWRFAVNQYDIIGEANANISKTYDGWIDLFGWGTGNNPANISTNSDDYSAASEWGINAISNGGKKANQWRALTTEEWIYLLRGRVNASALWGMGNVNCINGLIILPDNWAAPSGVAFASSAQKGIEDVGWCFDGGGDDHFSDNVYTIEQWQTMEKNGAVFLPIAGKRVNGTKIIAIGKSGQYWSATPNGESSANAIDISSSNLIPENSYTREFGYSVRLVH